MIQWQNTLKRNKMEKLKIKKSNFSIREFYYGKKLLLAVPLSLKVLINKEHRKIAIHYAKCTLYYYRAFNKRYGTQSVA